MKKFLNLFLILVGLAYALEYSLRIKTLGTDFAYLIPDYETDLYQNPQLLGKKLTGISYEPGLNEPLTMRFLFPRFGLYGKYWGSYYRKQYSNYYPQTVAKYLYIKDLWMLDLRGKIWKFLANEVWYWYNDGYYYESQYFDNHQWYDSEKTIKYLYSGNPAYKIGKNLRLINKICAGVYRYYRRYHYYGDTKNIDQWLVISSAKSGIYYRNISAKNKFISIYIEIGGPTSVDEIDNLPYSVLSDLSYSDFKVSYFGKTYVGKIGWAKAIPLNNNNFMAFGFREYFLLQRTNRDETNAQLRGIRNMFSMPMAMEYEIGKIVLRLGTKIFYTVNNNKEWNSDSILSYINDHKLNFGYSFGLSWQLDDHWTLDFYNNSDLSSVKRWAIYIKHF